MPAPSAVPRWRLTRPAAPAWQKVNNRSVSTDAVKPNRHLTRQAVFQALFEADFRRTDPLAAFERLAVDVGQLIEESFGHQLLQAIVTHLEAVDEALLAAAPDWPIEQVSRVDKTVLRIGIAELLFPQEAGDTPPRVAINEAVELAKKFGNESSHRFVNGVLGTVYRTIAESATAKDPNHAG